MSAEQKTDYVGDVPVSMSMEVAVTGGGASLPVLRQELASESLVVLTGFTDEQKRQVAQIAAGVSLDESVSTEFFAAPPLKRLSEQMDKTLDGVRVDDVGDEGAKIILSVRKCFQNLELEKVRRELLDGPSMLARLPWVGPRFSAFRAMRAGQEDFKAQMTKAEQKSNILLGKLKSVLSTSDQQYASIEQAIDEFALWLAGGQQAWLRMRDEYNAELRAASVGGELNVKQVARLRDRADSMDSFAAMLVQLRMAHLGFIASLPLVRMTQKAARIEVQNTLRSIFLDLPRIKSAVRTLVSLRQIEKAGASSREQQAMSRDLSRLTADLAGTAYSKALTSEGDFDEGVAAVTYVMDTVVGAVDRGLAIRDENMAKREAAMQAMDAAYERFASSLKASASRGLAR